jgi:hypothetical protein
MIACLEEEAMEAVAVMECQLAPFPVKYLWIPISTRRQLAPFPVKYLWIPISTRRLLTPDRLPTLKP